MAYNVYAERRGKTRPDEIILLLAHKDSQSWVHSPGAYDNAVGTVAILEIARIIAKLEPQRTMRFLWCNEEHYPWTSVLAANNMRSAKTIWWPSSIRTALVARASRISMLA